MSIYKLPAWSSSSSNYFCVVGNSIEDTIINFDGIKPIDNYSYVYDSNLDGLDVENEDLSGVQTLNLFINQYTITANSAINRALTYDDSEIKKLVLYGKNKMGPEYRNDVAYGLTRIHFNRYILARQLYAINADNNTDEIKYYYQAIESLFLTNPDQNDPLSSGYPVYDSQCFKTSQLLTDSINYEYKTLPYNNISNSYKCGYE
jgi:hypothetical protein